MSRRSYEQLFLHPFLPWVYTQLQAIVFLSYPACNRAAFVVMTRYGFTWFAKYISDLDQNFAFASA